MKEFYSINELATMTGFTTRSIRNFISMGHLNGEKVNGIWQFNVNEIDTFLSNPNVAPGIKSKNNSVVYEFLADTNKENNEICSILDFNISDEEAKELVDYFCNLMNSNPCGKFKFEKHGTATRVIISGPEDFVVDAINGWYNK